MSHAPSADLDDNELNKHWSMLQKVGNIRFEGLLTFDFNSLQKRIILQMLIFYVV